MADSTASIPSIVIPRPQRVVGAIRARIHQPSIAATDAREVMQRFGPALVGNPRNLSLSWRNDLARLSTTAGPKVLKRYREATSSERILHEHSIIDELLGRGFPVTRLNHTPEGDSLVLVDGRFYALFDFDRGTHFASTHLTRRQQGSLIHIAGATLGAFHRTLGGFEPSSMHELGMRPGTTDQRCDLQWYLDRLDELVRPQDGPVDPSAGEILGWLRDQSPSLRSRLADVHSELATAELAPVIVHGDYGIHNLLFRRDGTALVHDLELSRRDWRLVDLVIAFGRIPLWAQTVFVDGYRRSNDLPDDELELLGTVWRHHLLTGAIRYWDNFVRHGNPARLAKARSRLEAVPEIELSVRTR